VLIHLMHELYPTFIGDIGEDRVVGFLRSAGRPLALGDLRCRGCRKTAATFSRTGSSCRNLATRHGEPNDHGTFRIRVAPAPISRIRGIDLLITWLGRLSRRPGRDEQFAGAVLMRGPPGPSGRTFLATRKSRDRT
jgi:hypothetical protein